MVENSLENYFDRKNVEKLGKDDPKMLALSMTALRFGSEMEIETVGKTKFYGANIRALIKEFNDDNFSMKSKEDIVALCGEIHQRLSKKLGVEPCKVVFKQNMPGIVDDVMNCSKDKNLISIYNTDLNLTGADYLFNILHETYHNYQNQNVNNMILGYAYDKNALVSEIQEIVNESDIANNVYGPFEMDAKRADNEKKYLESLKEVEANLFAYDNMKKLQENGLIFNEKSINSLQGKKFLDFVLSQYFDKEKREEMQDRIKDGYWNIKQTYKNNKEKLPENYATRVNDLFYSLDERDIDKYFEDFSEKVEQIQTEDLDREKN